MSVALVITHAGNKRLVPIAPEEIFRTRWLRGATSLGLGLIEQMQTGFDVTSSNCHGLVGELSKLRSWMSSEPDCNYDIERLDVLIAELQSTKFEDKTSAFIG